MWGLEELVSTESKYFCPLPWVHFYTEPNGTVSLCCVANPPLKGEDGRPLSIQRRAPRDIWNAQAFRDARRQMATGEAAHRLLLQERREWRAELPAIRRR